VQVAEVGVAGADGVVGAERYTEPARNRRQTTFFCEEDYQFYIQLLAKAKTKAGVAVWAYCLMPNHVHFVVIPERKDSLAKLFQESHRQYTRRINFRNNWRGHLWQERFHSFVMDEHHLLSAVRYVELNPVSAGICANPADWRWSSAKAHLTGINDGLVNVEPMLDRVNSWNEYLSITEAETDRERIRQHSRTGRPAGSEAFLKELENLLNREIRPRKPGRKPREIKKK
jgi:putative transposase